MQSKKPLRTATVPAVLFMLGTSAFVSQGCDEAGIPGLDAVCCSDFKPGTNMLEVDWGISDATVNARFGAAIQAIGDFSGQATAIVTDLGTLCRNMAVELGEPADSVTTNDPAEATTQWCAAAANQLGTVRAEANLTISYQQPKCTFSVEAQAGCEAHCDIEGGCDPGSVELRCTGGELSVKCSGALSCSGRCDGSANLAVSCDGTCSGECNGTCDTMISNGSCAGQCTGECRGSCQMEGGAAVECEGECVGEAACSGTATAPKCTGTLDPPSCELDADCQASCEASASAKAECTPPAITIEGDAAFAVQIGVLKKYLPEILVIAEARGDALLASAEAMVEISGNLEGAFEGDGSAAFCLIPAGVAIVDAGNNIGVAVSAAANITAELN